MPTIQPIQFDTGLILVVLKGVILLFLIFYAIFSFIILRQVDLMVRALITPVSKVVKAAAIINAGIAIGLIILAWGIL